MRFVGFLNLLKWFRRRIDDQNRLYPKLSQRTQSRAARDETANSSIFYRRVFQDIRGSTNSPVQASLMIIIGIDLSGPSNAADTALVSFECRESVLTLTHSVQGASDADIFQIVSEQAKESNVTVGLDAPLSYNDGGKDRPSDSELRSRIVAAGLRSGSVMTPTMTRMAYLTLRGISVAHHVDAG